MDIDYIFYILYSKDLSWPDLKLAWPQMLVWPQNLASRKFFEDFLLEIEFFIYAVTKFKGKQYGKCICMTSDMTD